ncbi:LuxR C-terminal-related transcriptional regulator [Paenibacillus thermotolerans]|uniref:LuxR C-terminal-related transcriptional regulator n=1 Tax=Paenibacillus thermotolerans TaxID=3027807 RepID=UPI002368BBE2|nr:MULTISPECIES: LuxR C-terminal-related transcriptional regulator [unclassified Paenibacillus]
MTIPIITTKLYIPPSRTNMVPRPRLIERLNEGLQRKRKLTVVCASAGSGKTTLVTEWLAACGQPAAWLSLDEGDNERSRFLSYLLSALRQTDASIGEGVFGLLQSSHPPSSELIVAALINELVTLSRPFILVLDDYHAVHSKPIEDIVGLLIERMPAQMHLVMTTREDPRLPLARLRARDQLTEVRAADLRFTSAETETFLNQAMGLNLSQENISLLEYRTEGWIAGLHLAALSLQGHEDAAGFVRSFTGSHYHVLDYLVEEVLQQQDAAIQHFLLRTSVLNRMCGPLCDAVLRRNGGESTAPSSCGQHILEYLERANLFIVPLDNGRRWFRYHHLFADLLRQRLERGAAAELHTRASEWYEEQGFELEAFQHAVAAHDVERAGRLVEGGGMPLIFKGAVNPVLQWLASMPEKELNANPSLWVIYASALLMAGQITGIESKLQAAEAAIRGAEETDKIRDMIGHMASIRATLAVSKHDAETVLTESRRALAYLHPGNLPVRTATTWTLGYAYQLKGDRAAAGKAYDEALSISHKIGHVMIAVMSSVGLGLIQEADNLLFAASETYKRVLAMAGEPPLPAACETHLGLARIHYEWNDLNAAERHGKLAVQLARQLEQTDRAVAGEVFLARLKLARGEASGASAALAEAEHFARLHHFVNQLPQIAALQVQVLLRQGNVPAAAELAQKHELQPSLARVRMAQGDASAALAVLAPLRRNAEAKGWADELLTATVLQSLALHVQGETRKAERTLSEALTMAEPGGFTRIFVDEGIAMERLLRKAAAGNATPEYAVRLLSAFEAEAEKRERKLGRREAQPAEPLIDPLSDRELEVLNLIAGGLSNHEISERLFLALSTVKGHNRVIFDKLQVARRTEAVARARELGLL